MFATRLRISVVDDEEAMRKALSRLFDSAGFEVKTYASGCEFLDSLEQNRPDCVVLDLHMPELSGLEVHARVGQENPKLPVIFMTGLDEPGLRERLTSAGAAAYLKKPFDERELLEAIATATFKNTAQEKTKGGIAGNLVGDTSITLTT